MLRTKVEQAPSGVLRCVQIVCDACEFTTAYVEVGSASTDSATVLAEVRKQTGFVELGRREWATGAAPSRMGETEITDLCARCAEKKEKGSGR